MLHCLVFLLSLVITLTSAQARETSPATNREEATFDILEYEIDGNSRLDEEVIERAVYPHLGEGKSIADVEKARAALQDAYKNAGYLTVLVDIPEQSVDAGIVQLRVTEGAVERVRVTGSRYYSLGRILATAQSARQGNVPSFSAFQEEIAQLNQGAGRRVTPVLRQGTTPGTVEVDLVVEDRLPLSASLELNDRYSVNTSRTRLFGGLRYDNLWQLGHQIALDVQTAPEEPSESKVFSASYLMPFARSQSLLAIYAVRSRSDVSAVGDLRVVGNGDVLGLRWIQPLPATATGSHSVSFGLDKKKFQERVQLSGGGSIDTPISYVPLTLQYSASRQSARARTQLGAGAAIGLRGLLGNHENEFQDKRFKASANFMALKLSAEQLRKLSERLSLALSAEAQLANGPLISNEQMSGGGHDSVRGYHESEVAGDEGLRASLELRADLRAWWKLERLQDLQALVFVEGARLKIQDALPGQMDQFGLLGAGVGLRASATRYLSLALYLARAFDGAGATTGGQWRGHFSLRGEF